MASVFASNKKMSPPRKQQQRPFTTTATATTPPLIHLKTSSSTFKKKSRRPTISIGVWLVSFFLVYTTLIIIVTRHWDATHRDELVDYLSGFVTNTSAIRENRENATSATIQANNVVSDDNKNTSNSNTDLNPLRRFHLEDPFGHGVAPDVLLSHNDTLKTDGDTVDIASVLYHHIADKSDIPQHEHPTPNFILKAYMETVNLDEWEIKPLPNRTNAQAEHLKVRSYPRLRSCTKLPQQFPIDDDDTPTDADPFLPWIHDVFPTADGQYVQFIAQNRRRCRTGASHMDLLNHMQPQNALFQHISLKRINTTDHDAAGGGNEKYDEPRYRLASHQDADPDAMVTRFICRFKSSNPGHNHLFGTKGQSNDNQTPFWDTFSVFNLDYDWTAFRKRYAKTVSQEDGGKLSLHTSQYLFRCPVPTPLQDLVRTGASVDPQTDYASLFVDLIPVRTPPRYGAPHRYLQPRYSEHTIDTEERFDPDVEFGKHHVLPKAEDSGRLENIPICKPSLMTYGHNAANEQPLEKHEERPKKKHRLVSCLWASAGYTTRGNRYAVNDGQRRLLEWINYNKLIGFDHFFIYDNSGAFTNDTSLKPIVDLFPPEDITYIPWPAQVCNNNPNNVESPGERSSQYAAESSCLTRFGPHADWIGQFDIDEYFIPMGKHNTATSLLDQLEKEDTRIISFKSWRAWPRMKYIEKPQPINDRNVCWSHDQCFELTIPTKHTILQTYNCDRQKPGEKTQAMPAEKQIYRADYVLQHFVHYSVSTVLTEKNKTEFEAEGIPWRRRPFPDRRSRFANEVEEALMIHSKSVARQDTAGYDKFCKLRHLRLPAWKQQTCRLGFPWPKDIHKYRRNATFDGWAFNCYVNEKVEEYYVPKLEKALGNFSHILDPSK